MIDRQPRLTLWGVSTSRTLRALWALHELSLQYKVHPIQPRTGETQTPEFTRINPRQKIPVLQDGDFTIAESPAIVAYLSETYGTAENHLVPRDPKLRAQWMEWCFHVAMELDATSLYVMRRHGDLKHIYGEAPVAVESAKKYFLHNLEAMAPRVESGGTYLLGDRLSAADILLMTCLDWAVSSEIPLSDTFSHYRRRLAQRPAYTAALKRNFAR